MVAFSTLLAACTAISGVIASPALSLNKRQVTPNEEGVHDGYFFSWWSDGASPVTYTNGPGGSYSVQWQQGGNLVGGKGWNPGTSREISYSANWQPSNNGNSYLCIYGWTRNPLVEYYVIESHGDYNPGSQAQSRGSIEHAGSTYNLYESTRYQQPSIDGTQTFQQYWAIRQQHRQSGSVDMGVIFGAWANAGMPLGNHYYQVVATEAYNSAGQASVTVESPP
ncbi:endo-1,4-beta-xylanase I [Sarocladium strictum]